MNAPGLLRGQLRVALGLTVSPATIRHTASCPEVDSVGCATTTIPDHVHELEITFANATFAAAVGIGGGLAVHAELPYDLKRRRRQYFRDGMPFTPPYGDIHHRNSTLQGVGDPTIALEWIRRVGTRLTVGGRLGVRVPLGATTDNPDPLAAQSVAHEHMQVGSGTFDPVIAVFGSWQHQHWGVYGRFDARLPFYQSRAGYRGGPQLDLTVGPGIRVRQRAVLFSQLGLSHTGEESWSGAPNEVSARNNLRFVLGASIFVTRHWRVGPVLQVELANTAVGGEFDQPIITTLTLTFGPGSSLRGGTI